jgi:hypothetical protein
MHGKQHAYTSPLQYKKSKEGILNYIVWTRYIGVTGCLNIKMTNEFLHFSHITHFVMNSVRNKYKTFFNMCTPNVHFMLHNHFIRQTDMSITRSHFFFQNIIKYADTITLQHRTIMCYKITLLLINKLNNILTGLVNPYNIQYEWPETGKKSFTPAHFGISKGVQ